MSSYTLHHLPHGPDNARQLQLSRRAAERFAVLEAVCEQRLDDRTLRRWSAAEPLRRLFVTRRARRGASPA